LVSDAGDPADAVTDLEQRYTLFRHTACASARAEPLPFVGDLTAVVPPGGIPLRSDGVDLIRAYWTDRVLGDLQVVQGDAAVLFTAAALAADGTGRPVSAS
jgi:hypothetical protein